jgi:hypothetical protein
MMDKGLIADGVTVALAGELSDEKRVKEIPGAGIRPIQ